MSTKIPLPTELISAFCHSHRIRRLALFGSMLRDDFAPDSDVDVLVELDPKAKVGLIRLARIENELSRMLGRRADVSTAASLSPYFRDRVRREAAVAYEQA